MKQILKEIIIVGVIFMISFAMNGSAVIDAMSDLVEATTVNTTYLQAKSPAMSIILNSSIDANRKNFTGANNITANISNGVINAAMYATLQDAINVSSGEKIFVPKGIYLTSGITLKSNLEIECAGTNNTIIRLNTDRDAVIGAIHETSTLNDIHNVKISGCTIDGNFKKMISSPSETSWGIVLERVNDSRIYNNEIINTGIGIIPRGGVTDFTIIEGNYIHDSNYGIYATNWAAYNTIIKNNRVYNYSHSGISVEDGSSYAVISSNIIENPSPYTADGYAIWLTPGFKSIISDNKILNAYSGIYNGGQGNKILNNYLQTVLNYGILNEFSTYSANSLPIIVGTNDSFFLIAGNQIINTSYVSGQPIAVGTNTNDSIISGNQIFSSNASTVYGIYLQSRSKVTKNFINITGGAGHSSIRATTGSNGSDISENTIVGASSLILIQDDGAAIIHDNNFIGQTPFDYVTSTSLSKERYNNGDSSCIGSTSSIGIELDNGTSVLPTGIQNSGYDLPWSGTIIEATSKSKGTGNITWEYWIDSYANSPPTVDDLGGRTLVMSETNKTKDTTLSGWTTTFNAGDVLIFNVSSVSGLYNASTQLKICKN